MDHREARSREPHRLGHPDGAGLRAARRGGVATGFRVGGPAVFLLMLPLVLLLLAGQALTAAAAADDVPLISREVLFGNPDRRTVRLSPDGKYISFLAPLDGVLNVWVGPLDDPDAARPVTFDQGRGVQNYLWSYLEDHLLYVQDTDGDENWKLYIVDVTNGETRLLTPEAGVQAQLQAMSPDYPEEIVVLLNDRVPQLRDVYRLNLRTGQRELMYENEGFLGFVMDNDYRLRFGTTVQPDGSSLVLQRVDDEWQLFAEIPFEDADTTDVLGLDRSGTRLYMLDSRGRNTTALTEHDLETGETRVIYEDPQADVSNIVIHPTEGTIQAAASTYERSSWHVLDENVADHLGVLLALDDGDLLPLSRTLDDRIWIVAYDRDNGPTRYYRYDPDTRQATYLFSNRSDLEGLPLARMHPVIIPSRDGLSLVSYLTLPVWQEPETGFLPAEPLPMVLNVHGGPWSRDWWGYDPLHQWLANRGYAVLSVNFRGSTGFGKDFLNAGNREWAGKMHDDLVDAVQWAIDNGIADPDRVCIYGGSYGGYATLVGLTFTPDLFACGVDVVGPSNVVTLLEAIPPYWEPLVEQIVQRVGDYRTPEGREFLLSRSPLTYVDRIRKPLLIGQGANDPRVPQAEADQIVAAMQERGLPVTYVLYPDEGHGFVRPENAMSFFAVMEAFLHEHLGGRYEPIGDDLAGSSITVPQGAEEIPGLEEALNRLQQQP